VITGGDKELPNEVDAGANGNDELEEKTKLTSAKG
jgi:hypothetical protein